MKQIIIMIIILIIIFGGAMYIQKFLNDTSNSVVSKLEELKSNIEKGNIGEEEIEKKAEQIYEEWTEINERWSVIVLHDEIDLIETALIRMKVGIQMGNIKDSIEGIDTSIFLLNHIKEKEKTRLKNIF